MTWAHALICAGLALIGAGIALCGLEAWLTKRRYDALRIQNSDLYADRITLDFRHLRNQK